MKTTERMQVSTASVNSQPGKELPGGQGEKIEV